MSLKMKFIASVLVIGASVANAQSYDFKKELEENPEGANAAYCIGVMNVMAREVGVNNPKNKIYKDFALAAIIAADKAYGDTSKTSEKALIHSIYLGKALGRAKSFSEEAYQTHLKIFQDMIKTCKRDFPLEVK